MSELLETSVTSHYQKEVNEIGEICQSSKKLGIDLHLALDCDDPIESKLRLVNDALQQLNDFQNSLEIEIIK